jgi:hypothetical protein
MDAIRLKQILGTPLTEQELMCLQVEQNGFGCHVCGTPAHGAALEKGVTLHVGNPNGPSARGLGD